jgi:hypothetical protein
MSAQIDMLITIIVLISVLLLAVLSIHLAILSLREAVARLLKRDWDD